jgi:energy-coupling factor transporter ATP-binding protein EcfA2
MTTKHRCNPFDPAQPHKETFVGRDRLLKELVHSLRDGKSYALTGPPGIGKTTLLREVERRITEDTERRKMSPMPVPVHVECSRQDERVGPLFARIATALIECLAGQCGRLPPPTVQKDAQSAAEEEKLAKALDIPIGWALKELRHSVRPILVLDALQRITNEQVLKILLGELNNLTDRKTVNVLLAGRRPLSPCGPESVSYLKMLLSGQRDLGPLNEPETGALVAVAGQLGWHVGDGSAQLAFQFTSGHPYRLQYYLHASLEQYGEITPKSLLGIRGRKTDEHLDKLLAETADAPSGPDPASPEEVGSGQKRAAEVTRLLSGMDSISIDDYIVAGNYTRFDPRVAGTLRKHVKRIKEACNSGVGGYHNFLIWGSSGEGKTYFATETANAAGIKWEKINLARSADVPDEATYRKRLAAVKAKAGPFLLIIDECDKRTDPWVCTALFDNLSFEPGRKAKPSGNKVFVLIGSTGDSVESFWAGMRRLPAGKDLETRIQPPAIIIPETTPGDRLLVVLSQIRRYAKERSLRVDRVEKLALAYILLSAKGSKPRGIEEMIMQAVGRLGGTDTELHYSHLSDYGDDAGEAFVMEHVQVYDALHGRSLRLK